MDCISNSIKNQLKRNRRIELITNYRKNQKHKLHIDTSSRIAIEHFNSLLKAKNNPFIVPWVFIDSYAYSEQLG